MEPQNNFPQNLNQPNVSPVSPVGEPAPQKPRRFLRLVLLVLGVLVIAGGVFAFLLTYRQQPTTNDQNLTTISTTSNIPTDWQTYRNDEYRFTYKLPSEQILLNHSQFDKNFSVKVTVNNSVYDNCQTDYSTPNPTKREIITKNGLKFCNSQYIDHGAGVVILDNRYITKNNNFYYEISLKGTYGGYHFPGCEEQNNCFDYSDALELFDQILSTFKFTK